MMRRVVARKVLDPEHNDRPRDRHDRDATPAGGADR